MPESWENVAEVTWTDDKGVKHKRLMCTDCALLWLKYYGSSYEISEADKQVVTQMSLLTDREERF